MPEQWTIGKLINWIVDFFEKKNVDSPRLSAEMLVSHIMQLKRIELYMRFNDLVEKPQLDQLHQLVKRAAAQEPIAYLVGNTEFYSMTFNVNSDCLIPRPETEHLVRRVIELTRNRPNTTQHILDLCTGSACIACAIAKNIPNCTLIATDICDRALKVAQENVTKHQLQEKIELINGDLFEPIISQLDGKEFDIIVSNPPYVTEAEYAQLDKNVKDYEPASALVAGIDGLEIYQRIIKDIEKFLKPDGILLLEIGYRQGPAIQQLLQQTGLFKQITIEKDFANNDRVVIAGRQNIIERPDDKYLIEDQPD